MKTNRCVGTELFKNVDFQNHTEDFTDCLKTKYGKFVRKSYHMITSDL